MGFALLNPSYMLIPNVPFLFLEPGRAIPDFATLHPGYPLPLLLSAVLKACFSQTVGAMRTESPLESDRRAQHAAPYNNACEIVDGTLETQAKQVYCVLAQYFPFVLLGNFRAPRDRPSYLPRL
jgi:hypothetical protein